MSFNLKINDKAEFTRPRHMIEAGEMGGQQQKDHGDRVTLIVIGVSLGLCIAALALSLILTL